MLMCVRVSVLGWGGQLNFNLIALLMFYRDEHDEIERASMSSTVTGFNGVHILFKRTDTLSLDTALTLECGTGM